MKILSIDTASNICGVSILEDNNLICNLDRITGRTHSENLMPMISECFQKTNLNLKDINLIVCDVGPGSFTGIRIGVATAKAFNDSLQIPCIGISSLESLAYNVMEKINENDLICTIIDCKNNNCYFALYKKNKYSLKNLIQPQATSIDSTLEIVKNYCEHSMESDFNIHFVGDGVLTYEDKIKSSSLRADLFNSNFNSLSSYSLAIAGLNKFNSNYSVTELLPLYLKKPQAQRQLEERSNNLI